MRKAVFKQVKFLEQNLRRPSLRAKKYDESQDLWQARVNVDIISPRSNAQTAQKGNDDLAACRRRQIGIDNRWTPQNAALLQLAERDLKEIRAAISEAEDILTPGARPPGKRASFSLARNHGLPFRLGGDFDTTMLIPERPH